eukprot:COSAG01_NODE_724_length_14056_cov_41.795443_5_plen_83_part_00
MDAGQLPCPSHANRIDDHATTATGSPRVAPNPRQDTDPPNNDAMIGKTQSICDATHLQAEHAAREGEHVGLLPAQAFPSTLS